MRFRVRIREQRRSGEEAEPNPSIMVIQAKLGKSIFLPQGKVFREEH